MDVGSSPVADLVLVFQGMLRVLKDAQGTSVGQGLRGEGERKGEG